jgi:hypothetical protein
LSELQQIAAETPVYPDFAEVQPSRHSGKRENAGLTYFYRSPARYEDVKAYYIRLLLPKGWSNPREEEVPKWFVKDGSKALTFRRGEYSIEVEYDAASGAEVPYSVDFGWRMNGW